MTMILSLVTAHYALQISDRQLSQEKRPGQYEPWDRASNKSVILLAPDGLLTIGYSGPAFISGATTDGWIAEVLTGLSMGANREQPDFGIRIGEGVPDRVLNTHLNALADRLNEAFTARQVNNTLTINYVGLGWNSLTKPAWLVFGAIAWSKAHRCYEMAMSQRRWSPPPGHHRFATSGWSEDAARAALQSRLPSTDLFSKEQAVNTLIDVLRSLPPQDMTVSKDCLVTTMQREPPHVHVKYEPYGIAQVSVASTTRSFDLPASFAPWILTPTLLTTPQVISGPGWTHHSGPFEFRVEGPGGPDDFGFMSGHPRRRR